MTTGEEEDEDASMPCTTLFLHLFGVDGTRDVSFEEFFTFMDNLQVMVTPLLLLSLGDNLMMNCLPVCLSVLMIQSLTDLPYSPGLLLLYKIAGQHSLR